MFSFLFSIIIISIAYTRSIIDKSHFLPYSTIYQKNIFDCGIASLETIAKEKNITISQNDKENATQFLKNNNKFISYLKGGISLANLVKIASSWNLNPRPVKANYQAIVEQSLPILAHLKSLHYVTIVFVNQKYVIIADPTFGIIKYFRWEFNYIWSGYLVLFNI